ncbi:winged helix-turn-helix transcriptional regulator [Candidatus Woesearchaeota archaeon]|nr:winged helix-turn-helix transcriptional regulator [Candidatus Woesearchaeota archaeon]
MVNNITIPFLSNPYEWLHLADLSRKTNIPHPTARLHLNSLVDDGILEKAKKGKLTLYRLNFDNPNIIDYLVIMEKQVLIDSCKSSLLLKETVELLHSLEKPCIIFGSFTENPKKANDIDIVLDAKPEDLQKFSQTLNKEFHLIRKPLQELTPALQQEIIKKHLVVNGIEEYVRWILNGARSNERELS